MQSYFNPSYNPGNGCPPQNRSSSSYASQLNPPYATLPCWGLTGGTNNYNFNTGTTGQVPPHPFIQRQEMNKDWRTQSMGDRNQPLLTTTGVSQFQLQQQPMPSSSATFGHNKIQPDSMSTHDWNYQPDYSNGVGAIEGPVLDDRSMQALNQYLSMGQQAPGCHVKIGGQGDQPLIYNPGRPKDNSSPDTPKTFMPNHSSQLLPSDATVGSINASVVATNANPISAQNYQTSVGRTPAPLPSMNRARPKPCGCCPACKFQTNTNTNVPGQPQLVRSPNKSRGQSSKNLQGNGVTPQSAPQNQQHQAPGTQPFQNGLSTPVQPQN